jgi:serine phosphatase RsbU (regulator of sigma subunit)
MHFVIGAGDRLVLVSDGIAEAMSEDGQLFGFERLQTMLQARASVMEMADAAQRYGQEDDISAISIVRMAAMEAAVA